MANGMWDLTGWRIMTPEEVEADRLEMQRLTEEYDKRWPPSQRRPRCMNCGAFMKLKADDWTRCKCCGYNFYDLQ